MTEAAQLVTQLAQLMDRSPWLTIDQAAERLQVSRPLIDRAIAAGTRSAADLSDGPKRHHWRIHRVDLDASAQNDRTSPAGGTDGIREATAHPVQRD